ncbi:DUF5723 family protein [uncultured Maribacter sp.]|uniref:DUF5723 family protein n=1 Tax=uncultured Maribacter sp. TaxID=431308 RepID=UPI002606F7E1|nr:DUF5723 family protein [uncultured Maribacter sp.]
MRKYSIIFIFIAFVCHFVTGQNKQLLYDFSEIPQSLLINPGTETDFQWYSGVPILSGISLQAGSSGISVNDLFANDGIDFNDKVRDRLINGMSPKDDLSGTYQIELINIGYRGAETDNFYSFGIYNEGDAIGYWFKDYAKLGFEGNADNLNNRFNLSHLKTRGEILNVFHFGVTKEIDNKLTFGVRGKLYSGIIDFTSTKNKGYFVTTEGQNNLLSNTLSADLELKSSGIITLDHVIDGDSSAGDMIKRGFFGGDLGLGVDLGFTYHLNEQTLITGSLLDLGFLYHSTDVLSYTLKGNATVEGVEIILPDAINDPNTDFWQDLVDDVEGLVPFEENRKSYITFRPTKLYGSLRYNFGETVQSKGRLDCDCNLSGGKSNRTKYANGVGGQLYVINRPRGPQAALSAFYQRRFGNIMAVKTTYTIDKYSFSNVGLGLNLQAGPINMYFMADNLLAYRNIAASNYASFQLGINIISWGKN